MNGYIKWQFSNPRRTRDPHNTVVISSDLHQKIWMKAVIVTIFACGDFTNSTSDGTQTSKTEFCVKNLKSSKALHVFKLYKSYVFKSSPTPRQPLTTHNDV